MHKILALIYFFPRLSETFLLDQLAYVDKHCDLTIYSLFDPTRVSAREDFGPETVRHFGVEALMPKVVYEQDPKHFITLRGLLRTNFDILHFQFGDLYPLVKRFVGHQKCILSIHTILNVKALTEHHCIDGAADPLMLPTSNYLADICRTIFPRTAQTKIVRHYLGINTDFYAPRRSKSERLSSNNFEVLLNGRFVGKKGHRTALIAFASIVGKIPNAHLTLVGDGLLRQHLIDQVNTLGLTRYVTFAGKLPRENVVDLYNNTDVGIQPSERSSGDEEGLPTSTMECSSMQLPVVATRHAGIPEVVLDGITGLLFDEGDANTLAEYLLRLAHDRIEALNLGIEGRRRMISDFNLTKQNEELIAIYEQFGQH